MNKQNTSHLIAQLPFRMLKTMSGGNIFLLFLNLLLLMQSCLHTCSFKLPELYSGLTQDSLGDRDAILKR